MYNILSPRLNTKPEQSTVRCY